MSNAEKPGPELPSYALDEIEESAGWRRWLRGWRRNLILALAALALGISFGARPAYRELKAHRAMSLAEAAGTALDRGEGAEASDLLRQAALMAFDDERVSDLVTYHAARAGDLASVAEIGKKFGGRDHTTVMHAVRRIEELKSADPVMADDVELLRRLIES